MHARKICNLSEVLCIRRMLQLCFFRGFLERDAPYGYDGKKIKWWKHSGGGERNVISTKIMFAFTRTCIRPEEDAVTEILFRAALFPSSLD